MKRRHKIAITAVLFILAISLSMNIVSAVTQNAEPGSDQDPIVSKSYVDAVINELSSKIQSLTDQLTQMTAKQANQEKTIKALQAELKTVKDGAASSVTQDPGTGTLGSGGTGAAVTTPATLGTGVIKAAVVNLRSKPNTTSTIVGKLLINNTVTLVSKTSNWYQVKTVSGKTGYIREDLLAVKK